jgi:hypothetical protein
LEKTPTTDGRSSGRPRVLSLAVPFGVFSKPFPSFPRFQVPRPPRLASVFAALPVATNDTADREGAASRAVFHCFTSRYSFIIVR